MTPPSGCSISHESLSELQFSAVESHPRQRGGWSAGAAAHDGNLPCIAIVTDAWYPQVNGVVRTLHTIAEHLEKRGHRVHIIHPGLFKTVPLPGYSEIKLSVFPYYKLVHLLTRIFKPDTLHIATEGTLGLAARRFCLRNDLRFTTAYHTKFPEYVNVRTGLPLSVGYRALRSFHGKSARVLVATPSLKTELETYHFKNLVLWSRGVDTALFRPEMESIFTLNLPKPVMLYVGRVAPEKNLDAFLNLKLRGTKIVIGEGPALKPLSLKYPDVIFPGFKGGADLVRYYAGADVMVFPSLTDTFGLVLLEANACGTPVAAFPVTGPIDVIQPGINGALNWNLESAIEAALTVDRETCRTAALGYSWEVCATKFTEALVPLHGSRLN